MLTKDALCAAIASLTVVTLTRDTDPEGSLRTGAPHLVFETTTGKTCVAFFQTHGYTSTEGLPNWRNVPLDSIATLQVHDDRHFVPETSFKRGDAQYARIICG